MLSKAKNRSRVTTLWFHLELAAYIYISQLYSISRWPQPSLRFLLCAPECLCWSTRPRRLDAPLHVWRIPTSKHIHKVQLLNVPARIGCSSFLILTQHLLIWCLRWYAYAHDYICSIHRRKWVGSCRWSLEIRLTHCSYIWHFRSQALNQAEIKELVEQVDKCNAAGEKANPLFVEYNVCA